MFTYYLIEVRFFPDGHEEPLVEPGEVETVQSSDPTLVPGQARRFVVLKCATGADPMQRFLHHATQCDSVHDTIIDHLQITDRQFLLFLDHNTPLQEMVLDLCGDVA